MLLPLLAVLQFWLLQWETHAETSTIRRRKLVASIPLTVSWMMMMMMMMVIDDDDDDDGVLEDLG